MGADRPECDAPSPNCAQLNNATGAPHGVGRLPEAQCLDAEPFASQRARDRVAPPGSFVNASANFAPQNGLALAASSGAIIVAPNYRLGPFGYLGHAALAAEDSAAGNYGLLDQRAALTWVRDQIAGFGGNPDNLRLPVSPPEDTASVFTWSRREALDCSNAPSCRADLRRSAGAPLPMRQAQGEEFANALGCTNTDPTALVACLRSKSLAAVLLARPPALFEQVLEIGRSQWTPIVDGVEIPDQPRSLFEQGAFTHVS